MVKLANAETAAQKKATRAAYGATLAELAAEGVPVVAVDADLTGSTTTKKLADAGYAGRLFNCGIAEQNMIDVAAGLSLAGNIAFTGSFAVFGTGRAYDQIRNTVCYSNLNVKIAPTHAGISVGPDGGSHQMLEDVSLMRGLPGMRVLVPADYAAARAALRLAAADALADAGISAEVIDAFSVKPLDGATILESVAKTRCVVTAEEHSVIGGLGSAVCELLAGADPVCVECVAVRDRFGKSGEFEELLGYFNIDATAIVEAVKKVRERAGLC